MFARHIYIRDLPHSIFLVSLGFSLSLRKSIFRNSRFSFCVCCHFMFIHLLPLSSLSNVMAYGCTNVQSSFCLLCVSMLYNCIPVAQQMEIHKFEFSFTFFRFRIRCLFTIRSLINILSNSFSFLENHSNYTSTNPMHVATPNARFIGSMLLLIGEWIFFHFHFPL